MDTFDTAALRERVIAAWTASPARFREDANAEEELALGAYRDRLVVELAQNAADAATRAAAPGRLLLRLTGGTLLAANTGAVLDPEGVEGLSTLRASTKRPAGPGAAETGPSEAPAQQVGRFGVGFAAVLAATDEPAVYSRSGSVRWSRAEAHTLVAGVPQLAAELAHRGSAVPVLRLPFPAEPAEPAIPAGYDTCVVLPLRDETAVATARELLDAIDDALPLVLPGLNEIVIETNDGRRTIAAAEPAVVDEEAGIWERQVGQRRWRLARSAGRATPELLTDRPVEERQRPGWSVTVAIPVDEATSGPAPLPSSDPAVVHAPTPTDDRTDLPALIIGSFPLDSTRRRVAPGRLTERLVERIGDTYARLVASIGSPAALALVPGPIGAGELDAALHRAILGALSKTPFVPSADGGLVRPTEVTLVDGIDRAADPDGLAAFVSGLPAAGWRRTDVLVRLGARTTFLAELVDELGTLTVSPGRWREIYAALDGADPEALGALPVPLTDGRLVRGPRSTLLPSEVDAALLATFGLRVVDPDAAHPLLGRLGAAEATAASVLREATVRAAVEAAEDDAAPALAAAVLELSAASGLTHDDEPWLAQLPLSDGTGSLAAADELLLPGAPLLAALDVDPAEYTVAASLLERHGAHALRAVGVRDGFGVVREADVPLDAELWHDLDDEAAWVSATLAGLPEDDLPPLLAEFSAVRDLDLVRADAWPQALSWLASDPVTRAAVVAPGYVLTPDGARHSVQPYTAWWLTTHARPGGRRLTELSSADAMPVVRTLLYPLAATDAEIDDEFAAALGVAHTLADINSAVLLDRLSDDTLSLTSADLTQVYAVLAGRDPEPLDSPARLRVPDGTGTRVADARDVVVCDGPHWLQLGLPTVIPGPPGLAELLDIDLASEVFTADVDGDGQRQPVPDIARAVVPGAPESYVEHDELIVAGRSVDWWVDDAAVHAATTDGLARGIAWAAGAWERRWVLSQALEEPSALPMLLAEDAFSHDSGDAEQPLDRVDGEVDKEERGHHP